ncbi:MAG: ABC-ATPase domain-containing protein [Nesterenkonia sp.]|nr:ABC-ATPase domain-containing protein [Nesterenkonia sp.]
MSASHRHSESSLVSTLHSLDGRGYGGYKKLRGTHDVGGFRLAVDHVQTDPFAPPSKMRLTLDRDDAGFPGELLITADQRVAVGDFLARVVSAGICRLDAGIAGKGSGGLSIGTPGQQVLDRTSIRFTEDALEARFEVALPAAGRKALGRQAARLLTETLPRLAEDTLRFASIDSQALTDHVIRHVDQLALQAGLAERGLVAFVGDGAVLPRRSGDSDRPLDSGATEFSSPDSLRVSVELPSGRTVTGMGVPQGITLIVGGGYHGKSTLLRAIERGVYPHCAGDGREWVLTRDDAVTVRAEDGRSVAGADISPFISGLPSGTDTSAFTTTNASGSTSQATNLVEALEADSRLLLIDEDTSATNFMIRDDRMRALIPDDREPITPFVERIRALYEEHGVSTVMVVGGSGAFFDVADHVIAMESYVPEDVTARAREIAGIGAPVAARSLEREPAPRVPTSKSLNPGSKRKAASGAGRGAVRYGRETIDLSAVSQLVDPAQTQAVAHALDRIAQEADGSHSVVELVDEVMASLDDVDVVGPAGLDGLSPHRGHPGHLARPRKQEILAALNRYRGLQIR